MPHLLKRSSSTKRINEITKAVHTMLVWSNILLLRCFANIENISLNYLHIIIIYECDQELSVNDTKRLKKVKQSGKNLKKSVDLIKS